MKEVQRKLKEFFATSWAIDNRTSIYVLTIFITMLGVLSYISIPKEQFPEIIIPTIIVNTPYPGTSPEDLTEGWSWLCLRHLLPAVLLLKPQFPG